MAEKQAAMTEAVYYILLSLQKPNHGYGIIQDTMDLTAGRLELGAGTLYGAINTLLDKEWIRLYSEDKQSRKKKQYIITEDGKWMLRQEMKRLNELLENGKRMLGQEIISEEAVKMEVEPEEDAFKQETTVIAGAGKGVANEEVQVVF